MSRTSLHRPRRNRAVCHRPAAGTRLLPNPFPPGDGRSIDSTRHTHLLGHSRGYAPFLGRPAPAIREGLYPGTAGFPEAVAPRVYSPVASLGTPSSHGDGKEVTPDPLRTVERFPHTDRPEVPFRPVPSRVWRRLAPQPTRPRHGPSIAFPSPGEPVPQRRIIPAPEPVEDVQDAPRRAPRRESISKGGATHPQLAESPPRRIEGSSGGRPAPIPHSTLIHRDLPHSLSFRGAAQNVRLCWEESRTSPLALLPHLPPTKGIACQPTTPITPNRAAKENAPFSKQSKFVPETEIQSKTSLLTGRKPHLPPPR